MNERMALLATVDRGAAESETLRIGLHHAVAELSGMGGLVHLRVPVSALSLLESAGLPKVLTRSWELLDVRGATAPALAVRQGSRVWVAADSHVNTWPGTGMAAVPLFGKDRGDRAVGALTVLMGDGGEPSGEQWDFLRDVTAWAEEQMSHAPPPTRPSSEEPRGSRLRQALKEAQVGSWDWDLHTGKLLFDEAAIALTGTEPNDYIPRIESWLQVVHPDDLPWTLAAARKAIRDRSVYDAEYRVLRPDGTYGWTHARGKCVLDDQGEPTRMIGMWWDTNESRSTLDALSRALRHMNDGFFSVDDDWRIVFVNLEAENILDSSEDELVGRVLWELPAVRQMPALEDLYRKAASVSTPTGFDVWTRTTGRCYHLRVLPVPDGTTCYITDVTEQRRRKAERQATERAHAERATRIAELTASLAEAATSRDVVAAVAQRVLPPFGASGLLVQAIEGHRLHTVGAVGYTESFLDQLDRPPMSVQAAPVAETLRSGVPLFISSPKEYEARYPGAADRIGQSGKQSWAILPLITSGRPYGACVISFDRPRRLAAEERTLLNAISGLVAQALERARLYDAEHTRAHELQQGLLPHELPSLPACTAAARYLPARQSMDVGGDWYDIIPLSSGQVALTIGDVMGHGLSEAVTMGRLRTAVHTLAALELPPDEVLGHLNDIVSAMSKETYATCLYAVYDPSSQICSFARAGHPPPAVVYPDRTVRFPGLSPDPPLGAAEPPFETVEVLLPDESLLVLYTDGLVESTTRDIEEGMAQLTLLLQTAGDSVGHEDLEQLCDILIAGLLPAEQHAADDAALLVARMHAMAPDQLSAWQLPEGPQAAGAARKHIRRQLVAWSLEELTTTTELLASELVGNVVRHAKSPSQLRLLRTDCLVCEVSDNSLTMPRIRRAQVMDEGGRGLQLVAALSHRWGTRYTATGKCIWTEQPLPGADVQRSLPE